jgi:hypothetical protein
MTDVILSKPKTGKLQLSKIDLNPAYRKEWQADMGDFLHLTRDGEILNNNAIYRTGMFGGVNEGGYFLLLKYVEAFYDAKILKMSNSKNAKHLASHWCILDMNGVEKQIFEPYASVYLVKDSILYTKDKGYYNIETGELLCSAYTSMSSSEFIFLDNQFDRDASRRGVWQVNKKTGEYNILK